jgi:hypothetical protein
MLRRNRKYRWLIHFVKGYEHSRSLIQYSKPILSVEDIETIERELNHGIIVSYELMSGR